MATETEGADDAAEHRRSVLVVMIISMAGVVAGVLSFVATSGARDVTGVGLAGAAIVLALGVLDVLGVDVRDFSAKDYLYVAFMVFSLWFITWGVLLTSTGGA
ncbi:MAG: hypothetical protein ABEJ08_04065 [Halobacteriaceae archaeon]